MAINKNKPARPYNLSSIIIKLQDRLSVLERSMLGGSSGGGSHFGDRFAAAPSSLATGAPNLYYVIQISIPVSATLTGIRYRVGSTQNGNVRAALYNESGTRVADRTSDVAQTGANTVQSIGFDSTYNASPGQYFALIVFSSATATFQAARPFIPTTTGGTGSTTTPSSITAPTSPESSDRPILTTY